MDHRGRIANPEMRGQRVRGVYFFAGNWRFAPAGQPVRQFYEFPVDPNDSLYTIHPADARHLGWSETQANRDFALDKIGEAGANTIIMSYWGERGRDRWVFWAPMQTSTCSHDELFTAAASRPLLIMPAIESAKATIGCSEWSNQYAGQSNGYDFASDFPGSQTDPAPVLLTQCIDLIERYLHNSDHPEWARKWLRLFDRNGEPSYAINILHVTSNQIDPIADNVFADGFTWLADRIFDVTGDKIGFTLDIMRDAQTLPVRLADCRGWVPSFRIHHETVTRRSAAVTAAANTESHLDLFMIGANGVAQTIWWDRSEPAGYRPQGWLAIHAETQFPPGAHVSAVWTNEDHLDLFAVDATGTVRSIWWDRSEPAGYRPQGWFAIHAETQFPPGAPVTALRRNKDHLDLFAADVTGTVRTIWWDRAESAGYRPQGWLAIHPATRTAPGGHVAAQWATENHLDLFIASTDHTVSSIWWDRNEPSGYRRDGWFPIGAERRFEPGAVVAALWVPGPQKNHLDLFTVDQAGIVTSIWWDAKSPNGYRADGWFSIGNDTRSRAGGFVSACWIGDQELHLAMVDRSGSVRGANWNSAQPGGWSNWFPLRTEFPAIPGQPIFLLSREVSHLDLFLADGHGLVQSTFRAAVKDSYVAHASCVGRLLEQTAPVLAVQGFIPEVGGDRTDDERLKAKRDYWTAWLNTGVPVMFDVCPGWDGHLVFPGSHAYGNSDKWRDALKQEWSSAFAGIVFNTWNGYTEGYAAMPLKIGQNAVATENWDWVRELFRLAKL